MERIYCPETSVTQLQSTVASQKSEDFNYTVNFPRFVKPKDLLVIHEVLVVTGHVDVGVRTFLLVAVLVAFDVESKFVRSLLVRKAVAVFLSVHCQQTDQQQGHLKHGL